jgi:hypothetical protein
MVRSYTRPVLQNAQPNHYLPSYCAAPIERPVHCSCPRPEAPGIALSGVSILHFSCAWARVTSGMPSLAEAAHLSVGASCLDLLYSIPY